MKMMSKKKICMYIAWWGDHADTDATKPLVYCQRHEQEVFFLKVFIQLNNGTWHLGLERMRRFSSLGLKKRLTLWDLQVPYFDLDYNSWTMFTT